MMTRRRARRPVIARGVGRSNVRLIGRFWLWLMKRRSPRSSDSGPVTIYNAGESLAKRVERIRRERRAKFKA